MQVKGNGIGLGLCLLSASIFYPAYNYVEKYRNPTKRMASEKVTTLQHALHAQKNNSLKSVPSTGWRSFFYK